MKKILILIISISISSGLLSQPENVNLTQPEPGFEAFADGVFNTLMAEKQIAGTTFSMVKNGETIIKKGYGYANVENNIKVNPETTLFRIGSISKLFVWIGVMQMVEQGKLDLDADINNYLTEFKIPEKFNKPITLRSLMTHTPGFEDKLYQLFVADERLLKPIGEVLIEQLPKRVRPPFTQAAYSNHGTGIAQYLVEIASGMPFIDYAERYIFDPLGMQNTTIRQPLPSNLAPDMSAGYAFKNGKYIEKPFELIPLQSVGAASTTAADMARFMTALLNNTCLNGQCLLDSATFAKMTEPAFRHAPGVNPALLGFMDLSSNGRKMFGHGGNTFLFHSMMVIIPEEKTGIFYSFNSEGGANSSSKAFEYLADYYFPDPRPLIQTIELEDEYLDKFTGTYRVNRFSHTEFLKFLGLVSPAKISHESGKIRLDAMGETSWWLPVDSLTFRKENSNRIIAFSKDDNGRVENLFIGNTPIMAFNKNHGVWNPQLHLILAVLLLLSIFYIILIWPFLYFARLQYVRADRSPATLPFGSKFIAWITAFCYLMFFILFASGASVGNEVIFGVTPAIKYALFFPILAIPFTIMMIWQSIQLIDEKNSRIRSRIFYWVSTLVFVAVIWQFYFLNLLGWKY